MDTIVSQVIAAVVRVIGFRVEQARSTAEDLFTGGDDPAAARAEWVALVRAMAVHQGSGNRVVVNFPAETRGGRLYGHRIATEILDAATVAIDLPDTARITDHPGMSILAW